MVLVPNNPPKQNRTECTFQHKDRYLHGERRRLLVVVVQRVGHEGGVVGQTLAHAQGDGLAGERAVAARRRVHGDGHARRQHGHRKQPQKTHGRPQKAGGGRGGGRRRIKTQTWSKSDLGLAPVF